MDKNALANDGRVDNNALVVDPVLYTTEEVAQILGINPLTLHRWRWHNKGPAYVTLGKMVRYECGDLQAYIAANTTKPTGKHRE